MLDNKFWIKNSYDYSFIDLFCGSGGLSLGFSRAGFKCELAIDFDKSCIETFSFNHPNLDKSRILAEDINKQTISNWRKYDFLVDQIDLLCGGPPCQGYSTANRQRLIDDPRNKLYKDFIHSVKIFKPKFALMENVSGIFQRKDEILSDFQAIGYDGTCIKLNAEEFNIPQRRRRVFFLMFNKEKIKINLESFINVINESLEKIKSPLSFKLKHAINDLPELEAKNQKNSTDLENDKFGYFKTINKKAPSDYSVYINGSDKALPYIYNHKSRYNNERDIKIYSL